MTDITKYFKSHIYHSGGYKGGKAAETDESSLKKIYKLSSNENLSGTSQKVIEALRRSINDLNIYPDNTPHRLQEALSAHYNDQLNPEQFIIGNGGSEIIDLLIRGFMDEESECIVSQPCFMPYIMFAKWSGGKVIDVPLIQPHFGLDIDGIVAKISDKTRIIFLTTPNNPTGTYIPKTDLETLLAKVPEHILIVIDEVYYHYADAPDYTTALPYVSQYKNILGLNSFSKSYGLAALRLGYAYTSTEIAYYIRKLCKPFYINSLNINAGIAALGDNEFIAKSVSMVHQEKPKFYEALEKLGLSYWPSQANFIMIKAPGGEEEMIQFMENQGIMIRGGHGFGASGHVRVTIGTPEANDAFIDALQMMT